MITPRLSPRNAALTAAAAFVLPVAAQQPMGTVALRDASVTGSLTVHDGNATLLSNTNITANDAPARIALTRGGETLVCATSQFHLLHSGPGTALFFGLDRGAVEIRSRTEAQDIILTPDIRFSIENPGQLDLRLRVTRDGDTCVDNAGPHAPVLALTDAFSSASYRLMPGQHVLFEHGSLHEVVDHERSSCGCPPPEPTPATLTADATPAQRAAAEHPFPTAQSQDLTPIPHPMPPPAKADATTDFHINAGDAAPIALTTVPAPSSSAPTAPEPTAPPPSPPGAEDLVHMVGRFFHKLFHSKSK